MSDGEVINHREEVEKVELPRRERGSRQAGVTPLGGKQPRLSSP